MKKYKPAWTKWLEWSSNYDEINPCHADPLYVALYLNDIFPKDRKVGALTVAVLGIHWGHISSGLHSPTEDPFVKLALEGGQRMLSKNTVKNQKETLSQDIITKITNKIATSENILEIRNVVLILLGFSGFMRISELLPLKVKHISFTESGMKIHIEKSKVDQLREGNTVS